MSLASFMVVTSFFFVKHVHLFQLQTNSLKVGDYRVCWGGLTYERLLKAEGPKACRPASSVRTDGVGVYREGPGRPGECNDQGLGQRTDT